VLERTVKRYAAYFRGWCQTFGEHESLADHDREIYWLVSEGQAGFVLPRPGLKQLYREILLHESAPPLTFHDHLVEVGGFHFDLAAEYEKQILDSVGGLLQSGGPLHVYLTSHLMYGTNARIMTLSRKKPLAIIYKEIGTLRIGLDSPP
jgi:hypothetical protein